MGYTIEQKTKNRISLIVKATSATNQGYNRISVPNTWTQQELGKHIQFLYGYPSTEPCTLTISGKQLQQPIARLCDSNIGHNSLLIIDALLLQGGSNKVKAESVELPQID